MLSIIAFFIYFELIKSKNLIFPFKKLTIEYLNKMKTISDFINFNIYANVTMGTPKKTVALFITKSPNTFYFNDIKLQYRDIKEYDEIQKDIENSINLYYTPKNSSSFKEINNFYGIYSDIFYLSDLNKKEKAYELIFNMNPTEKDMKLYGSINLFFREDPYDEFNKYFFQTLKNNNVIDNSYFTLLYDEYDLSYKFDYFNDDYNNILGNLIIGEYPHEFAPDKYKQEDQIKLNGQFILTINEIKFLNYSELDVNIGIRFDSDFIKGSSKYKNEVDKLFFNDLFQKKLCKEESIDEHILIAHDLIYSCENNKEIQEKIKSFPTLYFEIKTYNITFLFNYKELFKLHNNRLYFLVMFKNNSQNWDIGEIFYRKYLTSFDYYSKTIAFYKTQIDDINKKTDIPEENNNSKQKQKNDETPNKSNAIKIVICVVVGVVLIAAVITIIILVMKLKKNRKKRADELKDDDYEYIPEKNIN